jgi:hypothetical protein
LGLSGGQGLYGFYNERLERGKGLTGHWQTAVLRQEHPSGNETLMGTNDHDRRKRFKILS